MRYGASAFYEDEKRVYAEAYAMHVTDEEARIVVRKLNNHYKQIISIEFRNNNGSGTAYGWKRVIRVSHGPSMGTVVHEYAHVLHYVGHFKDIEPYNHSNAHGLGMSVVMRRVMSYVQSYKYWTEELKRRSAPKEIPTSEAPVVKTIDVSRAEKIASRKVSIARCESKIRYYTTLLKKNRRSLAALERADKDTQNV